MFGSQNKARYNTWQMSSVYSFQFGMMTTFAILVHEIPHEVSDFAILLRADFNRMQAVKAQVRSELSAFKCLLPSNTYMYTYGD